MRSRCFAVVVALLLVVGGLVTGASTAQAANLLSNPGFETGSLSGWTCSGGSVVSSPVRTGGFAVNGAVSSSDTAQCSQTVAVQPNTAYTVSAWVRGSYVYPGVTGGASTWTPGASSYSQLTVAFTSGASQTSAQVYLHGWYGQGAYQADDVSFDGPGGPPAGGAPGVPGTPTITGTTNSAISLGWAASTGTVTGYRVYEGNTVISTVTGTTASIGGLPACTSHSYSVAAYNSSGESAKSEATQASTGGCTGAGLPKQTFPGLRQDQLAFGLPAAVSAGNGYTAPADVHQALDCLVKGLNCGGYTLRGGASSSFRGLMTWSINWDRYYNWEFQNSHAPYLAALP